MSEGQADRFATQHRLNDFDCFRLFEPNEAKDLIQQYNGRRAVDQMLGGGHTKSLSAFLFWYWDLKKRQQDFTAADWTQAQVYTLHFQLKEAMHNKKKDKKSKPEVGPVQDGMDWFEWKDKFKMLLDAIPSAGVDQGILYVVCDETDDDFDPTTITNAK